MATVRIYWFISCNCTRKKLFGLLQLIMQESLNQGLIQIPNNVKCVCNASIDISIRESPTAQEFDNLIIYPCYQSVIMSEYVQI